MGKSIFLLIFLGLTVSMLQGCYIFSYYPETDTYVTTVETKKYVNRNYSRERMMEANNSDCYSCHGSTRSMTPVHGGHMHHSHLGGTPYNPHHPQQMASQYRSPQPATHGGMIIMPPNHQGGFPNNNQPMAIPEGYVFEHVIPTIPAGPGGAQVPSIGSAPPMIQPYK